MNLDSLKKKLTVEALREENSKIWYSKEICWRQKARIHWLKEGNNSTRFYHNFASGREAKNLISSLSITGSLIDDPNHILTPLINFYKSLYAKDSKREVVWKLEWKNHIPLKASWLAKEFTLEEIKKATFELSKLSSPPGWIFLTLLSRMLGCYQR